MLETKKKKCNIKLNIAENETILTQEQGILILKLIGFAFINIFVVCSTLFI